MDKHDRSFLKNVSLKKPQHLIALGFGSGLAPKAPGTFGSLVALPICMILVYLPLYAVLTVIVLTFLVGWYCASVTEKDLGMHDNSAIVIDEFAGMFVSVLFYPPIWYYAVLAFVLFRFFDVLKPFPVGLIDRVTHGGFGVMVDDIAAGIYALIVAQLLFYFVL
ncbi:MAG: phosphatidylglycerophosphatase A [Succinivibrio sp.]